MEALVQLVIDLAIPLVLVCLGYFVGTAVERSHYRSIRIRESRSRRLPVTNFRTPPPQWKVRGSEMVFGNVVISVDYFKRFLASLRGLVGGTVKSYESLMDRARREAVLRMKEAAMEGGYHAVINLRIETSRLASSRRDGKGTAGVEVLAFGTALELDR
jgi:uncharacterized protein YbjQ (UPF0145 family)